MIRRDNTGADFRAPEPGPLFNAQIRGAALTASDIPRLTSACGMVLSLMIDGEWRTKGGIQNIIEQTKRRHIPKESISRYLRHGREFGYELERRVLAPGHFEYRLVVKGVTHG